MTNAIIPLVLIFAFMGWEIFDLENQRKQLVSENQNLKEINASLEDQLKNIWQQPSEPVPKREIYILKNFHCDYNDCSMNDKFIIDSETNIVSFWDQDKKEEVTMQFNSTAKAIEYYANYMTILAY